MAVVPSTQHQEEWAWYPPLESGLVSVLCFTTDSGGRDAVTFEPATGTHSFCMVPSGHTVSHVSHVAKSQQHLQSERANLVPTRDRQGPSHWQEQQETYCCLNHHGLGHLPDSNTLQDSAVHTETET